MKDIKPQLIEQRLGRKKNPSEGNPSHIEGFRVQETPIFGETYLSSNIRTLKAVYSHFARAKRKGNAFEEARNSPSQEEVMTGDELRQAMEEAKSSFQTMKEVQEELNRAYKELLHLESSLRSKS